MDALLPETQRSPHFGFRFVTPLALGSTLNPVNSTMISTALAPIAVAFSASVAQTGWLIAGLYLTSAIAQPTMGRLAEAKVAPGDTLSLDFPSGRARRR